MTSIESYPEIQPVFDPHEPGRSMDAINALIPHRTQVLSGVQIGETVSRRIGQGIEIDGLRPYQQGDESKHIDWRATARQTDDTLMVRQHYDEITPTLWVVTDMFQARNEANAGLFSERDLAASAVMSLLSVADRQGMPTALVTVSEGGVRQQKPGRGRKQLRQAGSSMARVMLDRPADLVAERPLSEGLRAVGRSASESVVVVVSDFRDTYDPSDPLTGWKRPLTELAQRDNDLTAVEITNPWDFMLPGESDRFTMDGSSRVHLGGKKQRQTREKYAELAVQQQAMIDRAISASGASHIKLATEIGQWFSSFREQLVKIAHYQR